MKGIEKLREKLPDYQGKKIYRFNLIALIVFLSSLGFQLILDSLPRIFPEIRIFQNLAPFTPVFGSLFIVSVGFLIVYNFWRAREKKLNRNKEKAYQASFIFVATGIPMVISVIIHSIFPSDFIIPNQNKESLSWFLTRPLTDYFNEYSLIFFYLRLLIFIVFLVLGLIMAVKSLKTFGIDYMALVYVYYPEESTLQNHEIYSILRHPTYHGLLMIGIGSIFLRCSIYSFIFLLIFFIGINLHLKFVEEKELIRRFGESYKNYKKEVPAFFVKLKNLRKYLRFIFR